MRGTLVGLDRTRPVILAHLASALRSAAARADAVAEGWPVQMRHGSPPLAQARRGLSSASLWAITNAAGQVEDDLDRLAALRHQPDWPADSHAAMLCVRDVLRLAAARLEGIDRTEPGAESGWPIRRVLREARRRVRVGYDAAARERDVRTMARRAVHLAALRALVFDVSRLASEIERATCERG